MKVFLRKFTSFLVLVASFIALYLAEYKGQPFLINILMLWYVFGVFLFSLSWGMLLTAPEIVFRNTKDESLPYLKMDWTLTILKVIFLILCAGYGYLFLAFLGFVNTVLGSFFGVVLYKLKNDEDIQKTSIKRSN